MASQYNYNIFVNCPFDEQYSPLFEAILFSIYKCGFRPRCAQETFDAAGTRIEKIKEIISECRFGIHDISRTDLDAHNNLPRFNMPLELGIFLGAKSYGSGKQKNKIAIVMDTQKYRYQQFISDIAGQDISAHENDPEKIIRTIRNALNGSHVNGHITGPQNIVDVYEKYQATKPYIIENLGLDPNELTYADKLQIIEEFLEIA
ncbi:hypothetical protein [Modicisalibacter radicis]|uniref:hypothetical protein n=1 Tax=Halomonas sp. EAR18 TaxID=2518972 RepID=UPI00109C9120|nr:hypothetical protein [Halomonas sp. EAR18]